jgi:hypothetical protein
MGFNKRKMEARRAEAAEKEAAARRATEAQVLEDAGRLVVAWNERQAKRMPMLLRRRSGARSRPGTGSCGCAARPAGPRRPSTCGPVPTVISSELAGQTARLALLLRPHQ